ncbi:MAG TPA: DUF1684 domain-containing protein [Chitinophagaceae bacterium]|nr:DUF1684 domain-containing protein [Chitinophagaceae bacterium]
MHRISLIIILLSYAWNSHAQKKTYRDSMLAYQQNYINTHEVVLKGERKFLHFYPADKSYRVAASFKRIIDTIGFDMNTSSGMKKKHFIYGLLTFKIHDSLLHLFVYQSATLMKQEKLKDYLFVPFGDATSGFESYGGGRYMEFFIKDIKSNKVVLDFNKAYNPYCAYTTGYNCPIPPMENLLKVAIKAGEKNYGKPVH